jgi:tetratricopeptide (TPR) repeat protein
VRTLLSRVSLICLLLVCCRSFAADPQWVEVRSPHFSVITDAGEKRGRDVALHFEQMRAVFGALMTKANVNLPVPLQIVAFRSTKEMRQVAPMFNGKPTEVAGLFQGGQDRSFIMLDMSVEDPWRVVFHEYAHQLMNGTMSAPLDPWFEEGFAEYFSNIEVDNKEARVGNIPNQTFQILQQLGMVKVADLFRVQQNSKTYNETGDHRTTFYAESGLVVHYLYDNQLILKLAGYFDALQSQKKTVEQAIQDAFGMSAPQFDKALYSYFTSGRNMFYRVPTPAGIVPAQFTVAPVSLADARATLADIHAHSPDHKDQALAEFQEVLKMDPNNASALRGAGYAYLQQHDFEHAAENFRRAAQLNSNDPRVHYYYSMLLSQQRAGDEARSTEIKKELSMAIALDPTMADAFSLLGYTQAVSGEPEKGLETLKKAIALSPRNEHYLFNLANVYMTNRKVDEAIAIFRTLSGSAEREMSMRASQSLAQAENYKTQYQAYKTQIESQNSAVQLRTRDSSVALRATEATGSSISTEVANVPAPKPVKFIKGKLVSVDCAGAPEALLAVSVGAKSLRLHVRDAARAIVMGADQLSCEWKNKNVAINYRERLDGDGDLVSIEIQ